MADIAYDDQVDITDKVCPLTFVKAKVAIEKDIVKSKTFLKNSIS